MKIAIDIDDTLTNTREKQQECWINFVKTHKTDKYTEEIPENINRFGEAYIDLFWDESRNELFNPGFKENADKVTKKLKEDGHIIYILTSRPDKKYKNLKNMLQDMFNNANISYDYIITDIKEKGLYIKNNNIDILIDDDINHINDAINYQRYGILFNDKKDYNGYICNDWLKLYDIINMIEGEINERKNE